MSRTGLDGAREEAEEHDRQGDHKGNLITVIILIFIILIIVSLMSVITM